MRVDRWVSAAAAALAIAIAPGALKHAVTQVPLPERAAVGATWADVSLASSTEVPITPPGVLAGPPAVASGPTPTFVSAASSSQGEVFALLIGIDDYPGTSSDLRSAVADVDILDAALGGFGVPLGQRVVLRDGQATRPAVEAAVRSLVTQGGPGATYVLGYAGHVRKVGPETEALVLADGAELRDVELAALLAPATTQRLWAVLAACYAGGFTELLGPGRVLTAAAGADELAWEDPALNASYLVHYLVREAWLRGQAGDSVQEAFAYADAAIARDYPNRRPQQVDQLGSPLVLGAGDPAAGLAEAPPVPPRPPRPAPAAPPSATSGPPTTRPPEEAEAPGCVLLVFCG